MKCEVHVGWYGGRPFVCNLLMSALSAFSAARRWVLLQYERLQIHKRDVPARAERRQPPGGPSVAAEHSHTSASRLSYLRCERVVAEPREQPAFLCRAASPADASQQRAAHVFAAFRTERCVPSRRKLGCARVLCFRANDRLVFGRIRLGCPRTSQRVRRTLPTNTTNPCSNHRKKTGG